MNFMRLLYSLLCLSVISGLLSSCANGVDPVPSHSSQTLRSAERIEVVYFHRQRRCEACTYAEERISYIVNTYFQDELISGKMTFGIFAVEDKNNADIARKYGAIGSQLFINRVLDGADHIRYIEEIWYWGCIDNEEVFDKTVKDVIRKSLYGTG